jgi:hypothetical protein
MRPCTWFAALSLIYLKLAVCVYFWSGTFRPWEVDPLAIWSKTVPPIGVGSAVWVFASSLAGFVAVSASNRERRSVCLVCSSLMPGQTFWLPRTRRDVVTRDEQTCNLCLY